MTSLAEEVRALSVRRAPCTVAKLPTDLRGEVDALLADSLVPASLVARALAVRGHKLAHQTLNRHRRGDCSCPR